MISPRIGFTLIALATAFTLASCNATSPAVPEPVASERHAGASLDLRQIYADLSNTDGKVFALDPQASQVRIYAFRAGRAAKVGHNHVLSAPQFVGFAFLPSAATANARFDLEFRLDQLEIDNPDYRALLGAAFASTLTAAAIEGTREHMLGADNLEANQFPYVRVQSMQISGESPKFAAQVEVELHGQKRQMWIPLSVDGLPGHLHVSGSFVLRQTDFGARPYSVLGGLLAVQDEVIVEFSLVGA
jgi:polyisoprenoid-binding protein YceI